MSQRKKERRGLTRGHSNYSLAFRLVVLVALMLTQCAVPQGSCMGLSVGSELTMTIDAFGEASQLPCDFAGLGLETGSVLVMDVEMLLAPDYGGDDVSCQQSVGGLRVANDWNYQSNNTRPRGGVAYGTTNQASRDACSGTLVIEVWGADSPQADGSPSSAQVSYVASDSIPNCPLTCRGSIRGTLTRTR